MDSYTAQLGERVKVLETQLNQITNIRDEIEELKDNIWDEVKNIKASALLKEEQP